MNFYTALNNELFLNIKNVYNDNVDYIRYPVLKDEKNSLKIFLKRGLKKIGIPYLNFESILSTNVELEPYIEQLKEFYNLLHNEESRKLLVKLLAYRILGHQKVKLPLSGEKYWKGLNEMEQILERDDFIQTGFMNWKLYRANLNGLGFPMELYFTAKGIYTDFVLKQYEYHCSNYHIKANNGDIIIDAGACWGDTALYFASMVGNKGKIYSFEFIPSNLDILKKNISLNPELMNRITIVENPVWEISGEEVYYIDNGPGSTVSFDKIDNLSGKNKTLSIDQMVEQNSIPNVNFIKMDIEGAELYALKGAVETIKKHKPVLAIALYHSLEDLIEIPAFINSLDLGYKLFLNHYTIHLEETILFATID